MKMSILTKSDYRFSCKPILEESKMVCCEKVRQNKKNMYHGVVHTYYIVVQKQ